MKPELKRIETMLGQISPSEGNSSLADARMPYPSPAASPAASCVRRSLQAFPISKVADDVSSVTIAPSHSIPAPIPASSTPSQMQGQQALDQSARPPSPQAMPSQPASAQAVPVQTVPIQTVPVQAFPVQGNPKTPSLPRSKPPTISSHRHAANPSLAVSLLKEIEAKVIVWQQELEQIIQHIRSLYEEGPIVDGWLESHSPNSAPQVVQSVRLATLRHAEVDRLMDYIEEICNAKPAPPEEAASTSYRLCGLDPDGQLWSRSCPAQQIPYVSLAIARYQKLRILLDKKQTLENRLQQLVQTLTLLHSQLEET